jgi:hypothetical protein
MTYNRMERLNNRRIDSMVKQANFANEVQFRITQSDSVKYALACMQPIDPDYTANTYAEGDRVKNQLYKNLTEPCTYDYQGSVTNDTHIKARSDIDLLVLTERFHTLELPQVPTYPYQGEPLQDLLNLRASSERILKEKFPEVDVDCSGSKSIELSGGSLRRRIDVVPSNWYNSNNYAQSGSKTNRGIQILDKHKRTRITNYPFLHNALLDQKDGQVLGNMRKAIRLMKSLKYDSESIDLSSYDICAIGYNIPNDSLFVGLAENLLIVEVCHDYCRELLTYQHIRESISVPNGMRKVFGEDGATVEGLRQLESELMRLRTDILTENIRSFSRLADARIEY